MVGHLLMTVHTHECNRDKPHVKQKLKCNKDDGNGLRCTANTRQADSILACNRDRISGQWPPKQR
jgi:hypothetical protein